MKSLINLYIIIFLFVLLNCIIITRSLGQSNLYYESLEMLLETTPNGLNERFKHVFRTEFSQIINANSNGLLGNYVGLSIKDKTLDFSLNKIFNGGIIELNGSGAINDNIAGIFSENKFKTDIEFGIKYHKIFGIKKFSIYNSDFELIRSELNDIKNKNRLYITKESSEIQEAKLNTELKGKELNSLELKYNEMIRKKTNEPIDLNKDNEYTIQKNIIQAEIKAIDYKINNYISYKEKRYLELKNNLDDPKSTKFAQKEQFIIDSLMILHELHLMINLKSEKNKELIELERKISENLVNEKTLAKAKNDIELAKINLKIASDKYEHTYNYGILEANNKFVDERKKLLDKLAKFRAKDIHLYWISFSGSLSNQTYKIFDRNKMAVDQIYKEQDLIPSLGFTFSIYKNDVIPGSKPKFRSREITLLVIGSKILFGNNISALKEIEIQTVDTVNQNRFIIDTQKAFEGVFKKGFETGQIFVDYYNVGWTEQNLGLHLRATLDLGPLAPVYSARAGFIFSAMKKDENKSNVNFELFFGLEDIFKKDGEKELFNRNSIGIQTTVPFTF